jgi:hypothetical protein
MLTYRLRRYHAIYPPFFDERGWPVPGLGQQVDTIYVLDRPVRHHGKEFSMLGPKPCPFAYLSKGAGYLSSSDPSWVGKNVDDIELPNEDVDQISCSAVLPVLDSTKDGAGMSTVNRFASSPHSMKHVYIRPYEVFFPHYEEDLSFQACAPQATHFRDASLHFSKNAETGNVAWCTESYPTQNPYLPQGDSSFTSHIVKNSSSPQCDAGGKSFCHRTVYLSSANQLSGSSQNTSWTHLPLLAKSADVEAVISNDSSYECRLTSGHESSVGHSTPKDGCCNKDVVHMKRNGAAHLEPDTSCGIPNH